MEGTMNWYIPAKRHGFSQTDEGERLRVDESGFAPGELLARRCRETMVRFERTAGEHDGPRGDRGDDRAAHVAVTFVPLTLERQARAQARR